MLSFIPYRLVVCYGSVTWLQYAPRHSLILLSFSNRYFDEADERIPDTFKCFSCRGAKATSEEDVTPYRKQEVERTLNELAGLALFRRAIHIHRKSGILSMNVVARRLGESDGSTVQDATADWPAAYRD